MQINQLNLAIRQLTMREFCHEYGANALIVFQKQAKERMQQVKKRTRDEMEKDDEETAQVLKPQQEPRSPIIKRTKRKLPKRPDATAKRVRVADAKGSSQSPPPVEPNTGSETSNQAHTGTRPAERHDEEEFGPMFVHLERSDHPRIAFKLDPQHSIDELGQFTVNMPNEVFGRMNQAQRERLHGQIEHIQSQLEKVKVQLKAT
ncbi:hypothetical protein BJV82DRAFT_626587 [Fennellomyces sp. T-0311]|nr:hypothetical protein BJV82DRAFT_626587 [Fennellomyces sp. T-0311]